MKGKLIPFYRAAKPSSTSGTSHVQYTSSKAMKPISQSSAPSVPASVGFVVHQDYVKPKVSFVLPDNTRDLPVQFDNLYGISVDEGVDTKAATYISSVQERFKLERINSERMKCSEMIR
ncbi:hypothetical protein L484_010790 [Morus notabilis]|uniref:Uncharacterized protein n=2 Tax=Morus notabilis TaxID=981085 RepID=W9SYV9_9ROSA|nr:hypothetical protein L484_010790 [Morus notabilis]